MSKELRIVSMRLAGDTARLRTAEFRGAAHLIVPVVAIREGVIRAMNSDSPEFVPIEALSRAPGSWNGRPIVSVHPVIGGEVVSANDPRLLEERSFGQVFGTEIKAKNLEMEAWLDLERCKTLGGNAQAVVDRVNAGEEVEVSIGAMVTLEAKSGNYKGKSFNRVWSEVFPDHLAMLPEGFKGACNNEMGCGANRALMADGSCTPVYLEVDAESPEPKSLRERLLSFFKAFTEVPADEQEAVAKALEALQNPDTSVTEIIAASVAEKKAACSCHDKHEGDEMKTKTEKIAALIANKKTLFKDADKAYLEGLSEERLTELEADAAKLDEVLATPPQPSNPNPGTPAPQPPTTPAPTTPAPQPPTTQPKQLSEKEWMDSAPKAVRDVVIRAQQADAAAKTKLVTAIKGAQSVYTDEDLNAMSNDQLEKLSLALKVNEPVEPTVRHASAGDEKNVAPPPPDLNKAIRESRGIKAIN